MVRNDRWLGHIDHRAQVWAAWSLGVLMQRCPGQYAWHRRELPSGKLEFTAIVDADAFRRIHEEQSRLKGWDIDALLKK